MKNEVFSWNRFWNYFKFDFSRMWRTHTKAAIFIGFSGVIFYLIYGLISMVAAFSWSSPHIAIRMMVMMMAFLALVFYQTRTYGYLTEKKAGTAWLMIPASITEKFVSMMIMSLIVIPAAFFAVFLASDALLTLIDPTMTDSIFGGTGALLSEAGSEIGLENGKVVLAEDGMEFTFSLAPLIYGTVMQYINNILLFVLCGICFKKFKVAGGIGIIFALSIISTIAAALFIPSFESWAMEVDTLSSTEQIGKVTDFVNGAFTWCNIASTLVAAGLGAGIWYRLRTISH